MTQNDKTSKILERVRALLAKAADVSIGEAEADLLRGKADTLMAQYAIEQWQVDQAQKGLNKSATPEQRDIDFSFYDYESPLATTWWSLFTNVATHCRCVAVPHGRVTSVKMPVIGLPSDLDYFDMLFTDLMMQLGARLQPKPSKDKTLDENLATLKESGMKWLDIAKSLQNIGQVPEGEIKRAQLVSFTKRYSDFCKETGRERLNISPATFQRSFGEGFSVEVRTRLRNLRADQEKQDTTGSYLPAVTDLLEKARAMAFELHGEMPAGTITTRRARTDGAAHRAGVNAGREVNLTGHHGRRVGGQGALNA